MKRALSLFLSALLLTGCGNSDNLQQEQHATTQHAEESVSHGETNKQEYPPHKPEGCDPDLGKYAPTDATNKASQTSQTTRPSTYAAQSLKANLAPMKKTPNTNNSGTVKATTITETRSEYSETHNKGS